MQPAAAPVGIVGAGTMGAGIAQVAAVAGHPVILLDAAPGRARAAIEEIGRRLDRLADTARLPAVAAADARQRLTPAGGMARLAGCTLVIEAAAESLDVKREILEQAEAVVGAGCLLASNTSSLSITAIAAGLRRPGRCMGMHFFNPAPVMPLVEVVSGVATDPAAAAAVAEIAAAWGKTPVHVASTPGFIVNRVARPFYGEALRTLDEGAASAATIDAVLREAGGFRMGPLELTDMIGQDVNLAVTRAVWEAFAWDPRYAPSLVQQAMVDADLLGRKSGRGFYTYGEGAANPAADTAAPGSPPPSATVRGDWGPWQALWARISMAGVGVRHTGDPAGPAVAALPAGARMASTDGRTATERAAALGTPVVLVDLVLDAATARRFVLAPSAGCSPAQLAEAIGLLQATGAPVTVLADVPGLLVARTAAMLVNEAVDVVGRGVATAADVDIAMKLGAGYPVGPLQWGDQIGAGRVVGLLDALATTYGDGRYRVCPTLRRAAVVGGTLSEL